MFFLLICIFIRILVFSFFIQFILVGLKNFKFLLTYVFRWSLSFILIIIFFIIIITINSLIWVLTFGINFSQVFFYSFRMWCLRIILWRQKLKKYVTNIVFVSLLLFGFDGFVYSLRPVTLTLRILINISLGHVVIELISLKFIGLTILIWSFEIFVYFIQLFVFLVLVVSYLSIT